MASPEVSYLEEADDYADRFVRLRLGEIVAHATGAQITALAGKIVTAMWPSADVSHLKPGRLVSPRLRGPACGWP